MARSTDFTIPMPKGFSLDDLFSTQEMRDSDKLAKIREIPIDQIDDFPDHPFQVRDDEDMDHLVDSIRQNGVISPATVRQKSDGRYELLSGHRRKHACILLEMKTLRCEVVELDDDQAAIFMVESNYHRSKILPSEKAFARKHACILLEMKTLRCEVVELDDDQAAIFMVESNYHRSKILPSEKAFAYKMRMDAMKRQGKRTDLTLSPVETKLRSSELIAQNTGDSRAQVDRYIRLTELVKPMLDLVDADTLSLRAAVELSYISTDSQELILLVMEDVKCKAPSMAQAAKLRKLAQEGTLDESAMYQVLAKPAKAAPKPLKLPRERIASFFPEDVTPEAMEEEIYEALLAWRRNGGKKDA